MDVDGSVFLNRLSRPAVGIRIPEILLNGILNACKKRNVAIAFSLSFGRETAPEYVINATPGTYPIVVGHSGTSIKKYALKAAEAAREKRVLVEIEAGHIMIVKSAAKAVQRISGVKVTGRMSESEIRQGIQYITSEIEEAVSTGVIWSYTIDTNALVRYDVDEMDDDHVEREFNQTFSENQQQELFNAYLRIFELPLEGAKTLSYSIQRPQLMRMALKFNESIRYGLEIFNLIRAMASPGPFGIEIAFDESDCVTRDEELLFYLGEWQRNGAQANFVAPNVGFEKRKDYDGNLDELADRVRRYHSIASYYKASLCFHSGSGSGPYSGKGRGVYDAILAATEGNLKYMISGVYMELVFQLLSSFPHGSEERILYERIFNEVYSYLVAEQDRDGELSSPTLADQLKKHDDETKSGMTRIMDPKADFFRHYSFLALNMRDDHGDRFLRKAIVDLYNAHEGFRNVVDQEVQALTLRLIDGLRFTDNISGIAHLLL